MLSGRDGWRWITMGLLAAAVLSVRPGFSQNGPSPIKITPGPAPAPAADDKPAAADDTKTDDAKTDDEKKDDTKVEKKDPNDISGGLGSMDQVRKPPTTQKAPPKGLWEDLVSQSYLPPAKRAQRLLFCGQYEKAQDAYTELLKTDAGKQEYLEGLCDAILSQGHEADTKRFNDKVAELTEAQRSSPKMIRLRAQALLERGKDAEGRALLKAFVDAHPKLDAADPEVLATFNAYGRALEDAAEYGPATGIYMKLVALEEGKLPDDPQAATEITFALYRDSVLESTGRDRYQAVLAQLATIEQMDQTYWPERLVVAEVMLAAHNDKDAGKALGEVLALNPNDLFTRFLSVDHSIAGYKFDAARTQLDEIKKHTDIALVDACEGRLLLKERLPEQAIAPLLAALAKNPQLAEARGWLAGAYYLLGNDEAKMKQQLEAIKAPTHSGMHPVALYEAGEVLRDARQFAQAEKLYLETTQAASWWSEPYAALAQLYLETGQEAKSKEMYETSFKIDPYNMRAKNQLTLLEDLQAFQTKESKTRLAPGSDMPAFVIRYDKQDEILAGLVIEWMEKVRPEIWSYFQIKELPAPTQIELFPSHEEFGVRTTGLPWIGTVGASTGNVIAMDVPRGTGKDMMGAFDWARVLRHEYTHTVTLAMTNNRIPHWLTEACACEQEQAPRDWENCQLLWLNYRTGGLFKIANLNWAFILPKKSTDRQLAYMESQWIYEYLVATYGLPKMLDFLHAFHDGDTEAQAWQKAYGKTMDDMDKEFHDWAGKQIAGWGLPLDPLPEQKVLQDAIKANPKDVEALVNLATLEAMSKKGKQARDHLEAALKVDAKNVKGRELLGAILAQSKVAADKAQAKTLVEGLVADDPKRPLAVRTLGILAMDRSDYTDAEKWFKQLQALCPLDDASYNNLAGIYLVKKDYPQAIAQLLELQRHEQHDERIPRRLATLFLQQGQLAEAEQSAYRAIRINPYNAINHQLMAQVLEQEKQTPRAIEFWSDATELQPKVAEFWEGLADAKGATGDAKGASEAAQTALDLKPKSAAGKWIKQ